MTELTIDTEYTAYCILGKVNHECDKLQYLKQWMQCYQLLDDFLLDCPKKSVESDQDFQKILGFDKKGIAKVTYKKAPTGGKLTWNKSNNRKICTLYLEEMLNEKETIEKRGLHYGDWINKQFPERDTSISFFDNVVCGYLDESINIKKDQQMDFLFTLSHSLHVETFRVFNQEINIYISDRYKALKSENEISNFIKDIGKLSCAVKIGKTKMPYQIQEYKDGRLSRIENLVGRGYGFGQSLEFKSNSTNEWETIYKL